MKKIVFLILTVFVLFSLVSAVPNINVEKIERSKTIIGELNNDAYYTLIIDNNGADEDFEIYSLVGMSVNPSSKFVLKSGENKLDISASLNEQLRKNRGLLLVDYQIRGLKSGIYNDQLLIRVVGLEEAFEIGKMDLEFGSKSGVLEIKNNQEAELKNVKFDLSSIFFNESLILDFQPFESKKIQLNILEDIKSIEAGSYIINGVVNDNSSVNFKGVVNYLEKGSIDSQEFTDGVIVHSKKITKINNGNVPIRVDIEMSRNVFSRLFTTYSEDPDFTYRDTNTVNYKWSKEIGPGENYSVVAKTNYTFPIIFVVLIVLIVLVVRIYTLTDVSLKKRVSYVKTKGGQFALRVKISIKARKSVNNLQIIDKLPGVTKLYQNSGRMPDKIDEKSRRMFWELGSLQAGEERVISYIIYSKLQTFGKFELPNASAIYEKNNKRKEAFSNKAFFISDTRR